MLRSTVQQVLNSHRCAQRLPLAHSRRAGFAAPCCASLQPPAYTEGALALPLGLPPLLTCCCCALVGPRHCSGFLGGDAVMGGEAAVSCKHLRPHLCKLGGLELVGRQGCSPHIKLYCRPRWAAGKLPYKE